MKDTESLVDSDISSPVGLKIPTTVVDPYIWKIKEFSFAVYTDVLTGKLLTLIGI